MSSHEAYPALSHVASPVTSQAASHAASHAATHALSDALSHALSEALSDDACRVGFLSSRLGRAWDARPEWFLYLRAALRRCRDARRTAVTAVGTAAEPFVTRGAAMYGVSLLRLEPDDDSPDAAILRQSSRLYVLSARTGGNVARLVNHWLSDATCDPANVWLPEHPELIPAKLRSEWRERGATCWRVQGHADETTARFAPSNVPGNVPGDVSSNAPRNVVPGNVSHGLSGDVPEDASRRELHELALFPSCDVLLHCTRRREGPWPDQSRDDYLAELILGSPSADRSPLAALRRILVERRIRASSLAIRGGYPVVSFTAESLENLPRLRAFRSHRHRWDFEPFGVAIRRDWLVSRGARPVIYGDSGDWDRLADVDRPFFQLHATRERSGRIMADWTVEREWRSPADIDLTEIPASAAWVFVPDAAAAREVARLARWPVVLVPGAGES